MELKTILRSVGFLAICCTANPLNASIMTTGDSATFDFYSYDALLDRNPAQDEAGHNYEASQIDRIKLSLDRFDAALGTLLGVAIWFESDWSLTSTIHAYDTRFGTSTASGFGKSVSNLQVRLIDPSLEVVWNNETIVVNCKDNPECQASDSASGAFDGSFDLGGFGLSDFIGSDLLDFRIVRTLRADLLNCGAFDSCWQKNSGNAWTGSVNVEYSYSTVPEPATMALMGIGLAGLGAGRLRKRKS